MQPYEVIVRSDVSPDLIPGYTSNGHAMNAKTDCDFSSGYSLKQECSDLENGFRSQFGERAVGSATLGLHIGHVVSLCSKKEVGSFDLQSGIATERVVTCMQDHWSLGRYRSVDDLPGDSMCGTKTPFGDPLKLTGVDPHMSVSKPLDRSSCPRPAAFRSIGPIHLWPKTFRKATSMLNILVRKGIAILPQAVVVHSAHTFASVDSIIRASCAFFFGHDALCSTGHSTNRVAKATLQGGF